MSTEWNHVWNEWYSQISNLLMLFTREKRDAADILEPAICVETIDKKMRSETLSRVKT